MNKSLSYVNLSLELHVVSTFWLGSDTSGTFSLHFAQQSWTWETSLANAQIHGTRFFWWIFFIILFRIWKWVSSSILNSKFNSEAYFSHLSPFASIWFSGRKTTTFDCHILLEHFSCGWCNAMTSYANLICKSNVLFISIVCRRVSLSGEAVR